jgi:hypothetical protein
MVSGIPPVGITQNERFLSCDTVLGVQYVTRGTVPVLVTAVSLKVSPRVRNIYVEDNVEFKIKLSFKNLYFYVYNL